eukprot:350467-Chlamydomonas_euryale.AAC.3
MKWRQSKGLAPVPSLKDAPWPGRGFRGARAWLQAYQQGRGGGEGTSQVACVVACGEQPLFCTPVNVHLNMRALCTLLVDRACGEQNVDRLHPARYMRSEAAAPAAECCSAVLEQQNRSKAALRTLSGCPAAIGTAH